MSRPKCVFVDKVQGFACHKQAAVLLDLEGKTLPFCKTHARIVLVRTYNRKGNRRSASGETDSVGKRQSPPRPPLILNGE